LGFLTGENKRGASGKITELRFPISLGAPKNSQCEVRKEKAIPTHAHPSLFPAPTVYPAFQKYPERKREGRNCVIE